MTFIGHSRQRFQRPWTDRCPPEPRSPEQRVQEADFTSRRRLRVRSAPLRPSRHLPLLLHLLHHLLHLLHLPRHPLPLGDPQGVVEPRRGHERLHRAPEEDAHEVRLEVERGGELAFGGDGGEFGEGVGRVLRRGAGGGGGGVWAEDAGARARERP
ncbi:hypothetical protein DFJ74DRAFT_697650 [Hyaloraphidium curvatum]|nr:hypothetical protein DFJ74DRAFT_697650 [Hyaloraphidium curvatum]